MLLICSLGKARKKQVKTWEKNKFILDDSRLISELSKQPKGLWQKPMVINMFYYILYLSKSKCNCETPV